MRFTRRQTAEPVDLSQRSPIKEGGEGKIYPLPGVPHLAAKIYNHEVEGRDRKLEVMLANRPKEPNGGGHSTFAWPEDILVDEDGKARGFVMPWLPNLKLLLSVYNPGERKKKFPGFNYVYLHHTARNLAAAFEAVHACGHVVGDVNESNVLVAPSTLISLIDTDSFQIREPSTGRVFRCGVGKDRYTPPELIGKPLDEVDREDTADRFGLAVLIHQLLMEGTHPFDGVYTGSGTNDSIARRIDKGHFAHQRDGEVPLSPRIPLDILHPALAELMVRCFEDGHADPTARPTPREWRKALDLAAKELVQCPANANHWYGRHLPDCPWCEMRVQLRNDPFPAPSSPGGPPPLPPRPPQPSQPTSDPIVPAPSQPPPTIRAPSPPRNTLRYVGFAVAALIASTLGTYALSQPKSLGASCRLGSECGSGLCVAGTCATEKRRRGDMCANDFDCSSDPCVRQVCRQCELDTDCAPTRICKGSTCTTGGRGDRCKSSDQCEGSLVCGAEGVCRSALLADGSWCKDSSECLHECIAGMCGTRSCPPPSAWDGKTRGWAKVPQRDCNTDEVKIGYYLLVEKNDADKDSSMRKIKDAWKDYIDQYRGDTPCPYAEEMVYFNPRRGGGGASQGVGIFFPMEPPGWQRLVAREPSRLLFVPEDGEDGRACFFLASDSRRTPGW
jgi:hypothetical protein